MMITKSDRYQRASSICCLAFSIIGFIWVIYLMHLFAPHYVTENHREVKDNAWNFFWHIVRCSSYAELISWFFFLATTAFSIMCCFTKEKRIINAYYDTVRALWLFFLLVAVGEIVPRFHRCFGPPSKAGLISLTNLNFKYVLFPLVLKIFCLLFFISLVSIKSRVYLKFNLLSIMSLTFAILDLALIVIFVGLHVIVPEYFSF